MFVYFRFRLSLLTRSLGRSELWLIENRARETDMTASQASEESTYNEWQAGKQRHRTE